jgi:hypothetical protein
MASGATVAVLLGFLAIGMADPPSQQAPTAEAPIIEPRVEELLRETSAYLGAAKALSFTAAVAYDEVLPTDQKIQYGGRVDFAVRRPDGLHLAYEGDRLRKEFWYDGSTFTVWDGMANVYATASTSDRLDRALDDLQARLGVYLPLADMAYENPYELNIPDIECGFYVGRHEVDGVSCHHVAIGGTEIDWQLWIEDGKRLVPRKIVITYHTHPQAPQYTAVLSDWDLSPQLPARLFKADPPPNAAKTDFLPVEGGPVRSQ